MNILIYPINCRGVSHTPENIHVDKLVHSGRMRYAPTLAICGYSFKK
ncbi:hypothetical protein [Phocaeicola salanitronis]|nr:hypothetical protein [Phocaeicola salanitronis]MDM8306364.1 hypothetical protein [Phocaeicola salanitronis]